MVIFLPEAAQEFENAAVYLEGKEAGLGIRFRNEIDIHVQWIIENPKVPRIRSGIYRRVNLRVFPYYIAYMLKEETIWILAIAHGHRKPEYWIERRSPSGQPGGRGNE